MLKLKIQFHPFITVTNINEKNFLVCLDFLKWSLRIKVLKLIDFHKKIYVQYFINLRNIIYKKCSSVKWPKENIIYILPI